MQIVNRFNTYDHSDFIGGLEASASSRFVLNPFVQIQID